MSKTNTMLIFFILMCLFVPIQAGAQTGDPLEVGTFTTKQPYSAVFHNNYLYIADNKALLIYNVTNPETPVKAGEFTKFNEPKTIRGLSISRDGKLYVAGGPAWIYVFDINDPMNPKKIRQLSFGNVARDVAISGNYMFVADANVGMLAFNLTNKAKPEETGRFYVLKSNRSGSLSGWGSIAIAVSNNKAYLAGDEKQGFFIVDVSNKSVLKQVYRSVTKSVHDIASLGNTVYIARADGAPDVLILNTANPYKPQIIDNFYLGGTAERTAIAVHPGGEYLYVAADETWHIFKFDKTPPIIHINQPEEKRVITDTIVVSGTASDESGVERVLIGGKPSGNSSWSQQVTLVQGVNKIPITATDTKGNSATEEIEIIYQEPTPLPTEIVETPESAKEEETPLATETQEEPGFSLLAGIMVLFAVWLAKRG